MQPDLMIKCDTHHLLLRSMTMGSGASACITQMLAKMLVHAPLRCLTKCHQTYMGLDAFHALLRCSTSAISHTWAQMLSMHCFNAQQVPSTIHGFRCFPCTAQMLNKCHDPYMGSDAFHAPLRCSTSAINNTWAQMLSMHHSEAQQVPLSIHGLRCFPCTAQMLDKCH